MARTKFGIRVQGSGRTRVANGREHAAELLRDARRTNKGKAIVPVVSSDGGKTWHAGTIQRGN